MDEARFRRSRLIVVALCILAAAGAYLFGPGRRVLVERPDEVRIGTASRGGAYAKLGFALVPFLEEPLDGPRPRALITPGSEYNVNQLVAGDMELAFIQSDAHDSDRVQIIEALFAEYLHIVVRDEDIPNATSIRNLQGKRLAIGPMGSGTRRFVTKVLEFFEVDYTPVDVRSVSEEGQAMREGRVAALCRVAGRPDAVVKDLLEEGGMTLIPLLPKDELGPDGPIKGFSVKHRGYSQRSIEARTYPGQTRAIPTIAVTALLVARSDLDAGLVRSVCETLHDHRADLRRNDALRPYLNDHLSALEVESAFKVHAGSRAFHAGGLRRETIGWMAAGLLLLLALWISGTELVRYPARKRSAWREEQAALAPDAIRHSDVFISYSTQSRKSLRMVRKIASYLEANGISCWYAPRDIPGGDTWAKHIPTAIERCRRAMVVVVTKEAFASDHVQRELAIASDRRLPLLPVRLDKVALEGESKFFLANVQWIDAMPSMKGTHLRLLHALILRQGAEEQDGSGTDATPLEPSDDGGVLRPALVTAGVLLLLIGLLIWRPWKPAAPPPLRLAEGPTLQSPENNDYRLGALVYEWHFPGHGPGVHYELERHAGGETLVASELLDQAFREKKLIGTISFRVRAHLQGADGRNSFTEWSESRVVEHYKNTLEKIETKRIVVVAASDEVSRDSDVDPELYVILRALEDHMATIDPGATIKLERVSRPWRYMPTLMQGYAYDLMAARISMTPARQKPPPEGWGVLFTDPVMKYHQALVHLPTTEVRVGRSGKGPCRIAFKPGTQSEKLTRRLKVANPEVVLVPCPHDELVYGRMYDMLLKDEADLLLMDEPFARQLQREAAGKEPVEVTLVDSKLLDDAPTEKISIATRPEDHALRKLLNAAIKKYESDIAKRAEKQRSSEPFLQPGR